MITYKIDIILRQLQEKKLEPIDARFKILEAINEEIKQQINIIDNKLDKVLDNLRDKKGAKGG